MKAKLHRSYSDFKLETAFEIPAHGFISIYGRSGSGKSSLLRCIAGLDRAKGFFHLRGTIWQDDSQKIFIPTHQRKVGYVSQEPALFSHLTVRENLNFGYQLTPVNERTVGFDETVTMMGLESLLSRKTEKLSGGEKQRVAIARALLSSPVLLLMDEPISALDYISKKEILPYFRSLREKLKIPVFYVSHDLPEVMKLCDSMLLMDEGKIIDQGTISEVVSRHLEESHLNYEG